MEAKDMIFMKKGDGENSYVQCSFLAQRIAAISKPVVQSVVDSLFHENLLPYKALNVADLGCSAGPNTFTLMETIIESVKSKCGELNCQLPEFQFYLNDLPGNDFNTLFKGSSSFVERYKDVSCFVMGAPGSFHGRLFPTNTLHLLHSSYSVHWLSKAPRLVDKDGLSLNKGKIYISETSLPGVKEAYLAQFQQDFGSFLKSRSQEMIPDGRVVLLLNGRQSPDATSKESNFNWELLAEAIRKMVSLGLIAEEKLDSFNIPYYMASPEEVKDVVDREGSFAIEQLDTFYIEIGDKAIWDNNEKIAKNIRSFTESMMSHQFGVEILDELYENFTHILMRDLARQTEPNKSTSIILVLRRNVRLPLPLMMHDF